MSISQIKKELRAASEPEQVEGLARFFKTGKGKYGEGDRFIGVKVPAQRKIAKKYRDLPLAEVQKLLQSKIHEHRLTALLILVYRYEKAGGGLRKKIYDFYLKNRRYANNWDLVDVTCPNILGDYLLCEKSERKVLHKLAKSAILWERRIAIISTFAFIRKGQFADTLKITEILLNDKHDLIHKAAGWMLREVGNKDQRAEEEFLKKHYQKMPRVMLRYAIEKFSEKKRKFYLSRGTEQKK